MKRLLQHIAFILLISPVAFAQVSFEASVSKKTLGINERLRVDFIMNQDGDNFSPPSFENFRVIGGPNQSVSNSWINGKRSYSKSYSYFLSPRKKGELTIGQATIEIDGETYKTSPIRVEVSEAVATPNQNNSIDYQASENIYLVTEISNSKPYINQAVSVVYKLYFSPKVNVSNLGEIESPEYTNFWSHRIPISRLEIERGTYKNEIYNYVVWKKMVLYPQQSGELSLDPLTMDVTVEVPTNRVDFFRNRIYTQVPKTISTGKRTIRVRPFPKQGQPANFSGAVGTFDLKVTATKSELKASESLQAEVKVSGKGNLKLFSLPKLVVPSALEQYDPEQNESVKTNLSGMSGFRSDTYTLVPQFQGKYPIPPISFSYFDPVAKQYKTLQSKELIVNVTEGPLSKSVSSPSTNTASNANKNKISQSGSSFRFIQFNTSLEPISKKAFFRSQWFYLGLLFPILLIPVVFFVARKKEDYNSDIRGVRLRKANRLAKKYLSEAKKNLTKKDTFYIALERALHNYLKAKISIETSEFSKAKIESLLAKHQVAEAVISDFIKLLEHCELTRYTPTSEGAMQSDYQLAIQVISKIDKYIL